MNPFVCLHCKFGTCSPTLTKGKILVMCGKTVVPKNRPPAGKGMNYLLVADNTNYQPAAELFITLKGETSFKQCRQFEIPDECPFRLEQLVSTGDNHGNNRE